MFEYDKSSKWLIQHHGDAILRLAGVGGIASWRPLQAEVVQPRQLPDGLIEARRVDGGEPELFVLELATYPDARIGEQAVRDAALVYLDRREVPEVLVIVLHPKGQLRAPDAADLPSRRGGTRWQIRWRVIELWTLPAEDLLASGDVGLVPWVPLCRIDGPPEPVLRLCRDRIARDAPPDERENLAAVLQVLAGLRYNDPRLLQILGGRDVMIESPVLQELKTEWTRERTRQDILEILKARFGVVPEDLAAALAIVEDDARLQALIRLAAVCGDLGAFREQLGTAP